MATALGMHSVLLIFSSVVSFVVCHSLGGRGGAEGGTAGCSARSGNRQHTFGPLKAFGGVFVLRPPGSEL